MEKYIALAVIFAGVILYLLFQKDKNKVNQPWGQRVMKILPHFKRKFIFFGKIMETQREPESPPEGKQGSGGADDKKDDEPVEKVYPDVEAYVYDNITRRCGPEVITGVEVKLIVEEYGSLGPLRDWQRSGKLKFFLDRSMDKETKKPKLSPSVFPYSAEDTAARLFLATQQHEVDEIYNFAPIKGFLEQYGKILLFVFGVLLLIWLTMFNH